MKVSKAMTRWVGVVLLISAVPALSGNWNVPTEAKFLQNPVARTAKSQATGKEIFATRCVACHGPQGAGNGKQARVEYDLRDILAELTDGELFWKITHGVGRMPSYAGALSDQERWLMVNHLRSLSEARTHGAAGRAADK